MIEFSELWAGGPRFSQEGGAFPMSSDSVLLADFAGLSGVRRACDLGCGAGVLSVLILARSPGISLAGIEIQPEAAALCRKNLAANGWDASKILTGDLRDHRKLFGAGAFDLVVCNPPYFPAGSGDMPADPALAAARSETVCTLADVCRAAAFLCRNGGAFALVHRPERLAEVMCAMSEAGFAPKRLRLACRRPDSAPSLVLIEGRRNGKPGLAIAPSLILYQPDGTDSDEIKRIYHLDERGCQDARNAFSRGDAHRQPG
ncbi:MAG TPA: methyltransferase [Clostridiales bacterium]|nr:methyltransferase [Clostridiales bacterium]